MKKIAFISVLFFGIASTSIGQDQHFSQYFNQPMYLNPAMTGMFNGNHQLSLTYRNQWNQVHRPYHHSGLAFDTKFGDSWAGGVQLLNQTAGNVGYTRTTALFNGSYNILKPNPQANHLVVGLQLGFIQQSFDPGDVRTASQYLPGSGFDPNNPTMENLSNTNQIDLDAGIGLTFFTSSHLRKLNYFIGGAVSHISRPRISYFDEEAVLPLKYIAHGGLRWQLTNNVILNPMGMLYYQGSAFNNQYGINGQLALPSAKTSLIAGLSYRDGDAIIPMMGLRYIDLTMLLSYDFNVSELEEITETSPGVFEISIIYLFNQSGYDPEFICPRL